MTFSLHRNVVIIRHKHNFMVDVVRQNKILSKMFSRILIQIYKSLTICNYVLDKTFRWMVRHYFSRPTMHAIARIMGPVDDFQIWTSKIIWYLISWITSVKSGKKVFRAARKLCISMLNDTFLAQESLLSLPHEKREVKELSRWKHQFQPVLTGGFPCMNKGNQHFYGRSIP